MSLPGPTRWQIGEWLGEAAEWAASASRLRPDLQPSHQIATYLDRIVGRLDQLVAIVDPRAPAENREAALARLEEDGGPDGD